MPKLNEADIRAWLSECLAEFLSIPANEVPLDKDFADMGLDSVDAIVIGGILEERFDVEIDATLFLRNRNTDELIEDLLSSGLLSAE